MMVQQLTRVVQGQVLEPGDAGFDEARRLWNARSEGRPDLIVRCRTAGDVKTAVDFARESGQTVSVKSGGHAFATHTVGEQGLLIDLSLMKGLRIDRDSRTAVIEPGVTCGELDRAAQAYGLATPVPTVSSVGVAGAALGGGTSYLSRKYGLTLDNLMAVDVVTADGRQLRAGDGEHPDLFWAMRGAGANFGVAVSLHLRLHQVGPEVLAGQIIYPFGDGVALLRAYRDFMAAAPEEFQCYPFMFRVPPIDAFPARFHGRLALDFVFCHLDSAASEFVQPLRGLGEKILEVVGPAAYTVVQQGFDANSPAGQRYYSRGHYLDQASDAAIETIAAHVPEMRGAFSAAYLEPLGGAIGRVGPRETAFGGRRARYGFHVLAGWTDAADDGAVMGWTRGFHDAMAPHATGGVYVNVLSEDEANRMPAAYGENYDRLVALKAAWDPTNLFRNNYNIPPPA